jgi:hypothetical protein
MIITRIFEKNTRVMITKLTLTIEKDIIVRAKQYAKQTGRSLSDLVESYLEQVTRNDSQTSTISPKLKKIVGAVKLPKHFDENKSLQNYYEKKHV